MSTCGECPHSRPGHYCFGYRGEKHKECPARTSERFLKAKLKKCKEGLEEIAAGGLRVDDWGGGVCVCPDKAQELLKDLEGEGE